MTSTPPPAPDGNSSAPTQNIVPSPPPEKPPSPGGGWWHSIPPWMTAIVLVVGVGGIAPVLQALPPIIEAIGGVMKTQSDKSVPVAPQSSDPSFQAVAPLLETQGNPESVFSIASSGLPQIVGDGSASVIAMVRDLQSQYNATPFVYGINDTTPSGSDDGLNRLAGGDIDLAFSSRPLTNAEKVQGNLAEFPIGKDAIAVFVHKDNPIDNLTIEQLKEIYLCEIDKWSTLGWSNSSGSSEPLGIDVFNRYRSSGTQTIFNEKVLGGLAFCPNSIGSNGESYESANGSSFRTWDKDQTTAVIREMGEYGIYYASLNQVIDQDVKILNINGVSPTPITILDGSYPLSREVYAIAKQNTSQEVVDLIKFLADPVGQELMRQYHIPLYSY